MVFTLKWLEIQLTGQSVQIKYLLKKENKQDSPGIDANTSLSYWFFFFSSKFEVCDKTLFLKNPIFFFSNKEKKNQWRENKKHTASWLFSLKENIWKVGHSYDILRNLMSSLI